MRHSLLRHWNSVVAVAADHITVVAFFGVTFAVVIAGAAWFLAAATTALDAYAPLSYFLASLLAFLVAAAAFWLIASAVRKLRRGAAEATAAPAPQPASPPVPKGAWVGQREVNLAIWRNIDSLTLDQAACLWAGVEPPPVRDRLLTGEAAARLEQLRSAAARGEFGGRPRDPDNVSQSERVTRAALKTYADKTGENPAFLSA